MAAKATDRRIQTPEWTSERSGARITARRARCESADTDDRLESTEANDANEPIENAEQDDPMLPIDRNDPTDPMESAEPVDAIERNELRDQRLQPVGFAMSPR